MGLRDRTLYQDKNCFFVTTTCYKWYHLLAMDVCKDIVIESMKFVNKNMMLKYLAML